MGDLHIEVFGDADKYDIDDELMQTATGSSGAPFKKKVVEDALRLLVKVHAQSGIRELRGKVQWEGGLKKSRKGRGEY